MERHEIISMKYGILKVGGNAPEKNLFKVLIFMKVFYITKVGWLHFVEENFKRNMNISWCATSFKKLCSNFIFQFKIQ